MSTTPIKKELTDYTSQEKLELEAGDYLWCHACNSWEDDTYCYLSDHSRHCGHLLETPGSVDSLPENRMVTVCGDSIYNLFRGRPVGTNATEEVEDAR